MILLFVMPAIPDVDFASLSDNFTLSKSQSRITFTVAILNDSLPESSENFTAQLQLLSSTNGITLSPSKSIVTIGGKLRLLCNNNKRIRNFLVFFFFFFFRCICFFGCSASHGRRYTQR